MNKMIFAVFIDNSEEIDELSENFILFNDDVFPIKKIKPEYFFYKNKVCDEAIERIFAPKINESIFDVINTLIIVFKQCCI